MDKVYKITPYCKDGSVEPIGFVVSYSRRGKVRQEHYPSMTDAEDRVKKLKIKFADEELSKQPLLDGIVAESDQPKKPKLPKTAFKSPKNAKFDDKGFKMGTRSEHWLEPLYDLYLTVLEADPEDSYELQRLGRTAAQIAASANRLIDQSDLEAKYNELEERVEGMLTSRKHELKVV